MAPCQLSFLVLTLCTISVSAEVFVSIDCGSSNSSRDENLITWSGDNEYITTGEPHTVPSSNSVSRVMDTMRVFTTRKKNCYHINSVRQGRVLIRASFYYGNYDNKSSPPKFDLQYDGNYWTTVETTSTDYVDYELIYVMKRKSISVCLAQTEQGQFPFISSLEVRSLEAFMYQYIEDIYPLYLSRRDAFGASSTIRYPNDPYDRIWNPSPARNGLIDVTSNSTFDEITIASDRPPPAVLQNAITAVRPNTTIRLFMGLPPANISIYVNWYFSEVYQLGLNETRAFRIFWNELPFSEPIEPPYENCSQWYARGHTNILNTTVSLVPTNYSTLPPLINALEVFYIGSPLTNGTDNRDVKGLATLQKAFSVLEDWNGDPCLTATYTWDWIECSNETTPRVTALDLHNNSLRGPIPAFLGALPGLKQLNLANNHFNGSLPASLSQKNGLNLVVTGNPELCSSAVSCPTDSSNRTNSSPSIKNNNNLSRLFGSTVPSFIIMWFILGV